MKEDERLKRCVRDCIRDQVCKHVYVYVSMLAQMTAVLCFADYLLTDQPYFTQTEMSTDIQCLAQGASVLLKVEHIS